MERATGLIFDIQRFSIHDGPGIRTTVFLKGCPMSCLWCHNPESRLAAPQIAFYKSKCIGCVRCVWTCPHGAIVEGERRLDRSLCRVCGECSEKCPTEALQLVGRRVTVDDVLDVVMRDEPFYRTSGGGVTLSGGEPLQQPEFCVEILAACRDKGLHTCVDTTGCGPWDTLAGLAAVTDLFLYDLKAIDPGKHERLCGLDNQLILDNARRLMDSGAAAIFRAPLIPGLNDGPEDLRALAEFMLSLPGDQRLELMPYHCIGAGKYEALGMDYALPDLEPAAEVDEHKCALVAMGVTLVDR
jgi:pyruvate formate lyase activating enzyme